MNKGRSCGTALDKFFTETLVLMAGYLASFVVIGLAFVMTYGVIMRQLFNSPPTWTFETSTYMLLFAVFMGAAYTEMKKGHVSLDLLYGRLSPKTQTRVTLVTSVLSTAYVLVLTWRGIELASGGISRGITSGYPLYVNQGLVSLVIPVGAGILGIYLAIQTVKSYISYFGKK